MPPPGHMLRMWTVEMRRSSKLHSMPLILTQNGQTRLDVGPFGGHVFVEPSNACAQ